MTTTSPDTTVALMSEQVHELQEGEIETERLRPLVQQFITEYFLDNETITAQADFLARNQLYRGDFHAGARFVDGPQGGDRRGRAARGESVLQERALGVHRRPVTDQARPAADLLAPGRAALPRTAASDPPAA